LKKLKDFFGKQDRERCAVVAGHAANHSATQRDLLVSGSNVRTFWMIAFQSGWQI